MQTQETGEPAPTPKAKPDPAPKLRKHATINERLAVLDLAARGVSQGEIARLTGFRQQRVSDIIAKSQSTAPHALNVLKAAGYQAAVDWVRSFNVAVKRGEHRPMKDALVAIGVVSPDPINQGVTVVIGAGDPGVMIQAHTSTTNTLQAGHHNPAPSTPLLGEPYSVRLSEE